MEPLHNPNDRAPHTSTYNPKRSRWPGLIGAGAIVVAVLGVTMWAQHDDARKSAAPLDKGASVTAPAQPGTDNTGSANTSATGRSPGAAPSDESKVATQPPPSRQ